MLSSARDAFRQAFGAELDFAVRAPGRVNLIGEHTDYNDGFVLPMAIDRELWLAGRATDDGLLQVHSTSFKEPLLVPIGQPPIPGRALSGTTVDARRPDARMDARGGTSRGESEEQPDSSTDSPAWHRYVGGVAWLLREGGLRTGGFQAAIASDIPAGAGLSSSAALELALARGLAAAARQPWDPLAMARLCQRAEHEFAGNQCGILDQLAVALGRAGHALFIDCRSLEVQPVPLPPGVAVVICDSAMSRQLAGSAYNERRAACEEAARRLGIQALRDASFESLRQSSLPATLMRRARHVVTEDARVVQAVVALREENAAEVGRLMNESHASLRDDFEVSTPELDLLVELAQEQGCFGSRLTGAGFGGCTVSLVGGSTAESFARQVIDGYRAKTGLPGEACICHAVDGVSVG